MVTGDERVHGNAHECSPERDIVVFDVCHRGKVVEVRTQPQGESPYSKTLNSARCSFHVLRGEAAMHGYMLS